MRFSSKKLYGLAIYDKDSRCIWSGYNLHFNSKKDVIESAKEQAEVLSKTFWYIGVCDQAESTIAYYLPSGRIWGVEFGGIYNFVK